ncbi:gluconate 2-dehydrogenase subunit 3 family protein [Tamlana agarivorans]|uniref:Gluconate 2-dehydrogenase subunit 3 family protein n=1 Tax=Pseudotamlana agarivorans TaxID=481183 RepID=A0ACC5U931_9FLAO|nr:gluconate 2-dehydrogenase subunit 3 family protein [Tamlana agarivorans]MBU2950795.1 gluconate 2-dehydrogenase subunit 3 family protein [Tamlana agarivorans]
MNRRTALKNLTKGIGFAVATPTIMHLLASCQNQTETWKPLFLSEEEKHLVIQLTDLFIPKTDTPGAVEINTPQFLDSMYQEVETTQNQEHFKKGAQLFASAFQKKSNKAVLEGTKEDFKPLLDEYFSLSPEETKALMRQQKQNMKDLAASEMEKFSMYKFLLSTRYYAIFGYCTSEEIGENVLAYDPIPGMQQGCVSVEEISQGRAWSL